MKLPFKVFNFLSGQVQYNLPLINSPVEKDCTSFDLFFNLEINGNCYFGEFVCERHQIPGRMMLK